MATPSVANPTGPVIFGHDFTSILAGESALLQAPTSDSTPTPPMEGSFYRSDNMVYVAFKYWTEDMRQQLEGKPPMERRIKPLTSGQKQVAKATRELLIGLLKKDTSGIVEKTLTREGVKSLEESPAIKGAVVQAIYDNVRPY